MAPKNHLALQEHGAADVTASLPTARRSAEDDPLVPELATSSRPPWNNPNNLAPAGPPGSESLALERAKASFPVDELTVFLNGKENLERDRTLTKVLESEKVFDKKDWYYQGRTERFKGSQERARRIVEIGKEQDWDRMTKWRAMAIVDEPGPFALHFSMFIPTLEGQATDEQMAKWLPLANNFRIIGCYAQTELGHGSNVQGLETTATYIPETEEFEIHSPSLTASKWWIGGLGRTATHAIVVARLILKGKDHGTHTFIVQIRSLEDHTPLPGITIGDVGPKLGYQQVDNGFMLFDKVRVPRDAMLMRYARVEADGTYNRPPSSKLSYGTMVFVRSSIVSSAAKNLARAATIATRYSAVRRQFCNAEASKDDSLVQQPACPTTVVETAVIDYPMQQYRLMTRIAQSYALHFTGVAMMDLYNELTQLLAEGNLAILPEVHATSSGLKSLTTDIAYAGLEDLRRACGGHGFLKVSGFPEFIGDYAPNVTYEGDNYMLTQQTARYLLKSFRGLRKLVASGSQVNPTQLTPTTRYLLAAAAPGFAQQTWPVQTVDDLMNSANITAAFAFRAGCMVAQLVQSIDSKQQTFTSAQLDILKVSRAHCEYVIIDNFARALVDPRTASLSSQTLSVLRKLFFLFALDTLENSLGSFLSISPTYISPPQIALIKAQILRLIADLRPDAVSLVDAWGFSDYFLNSALGRYDGRVYEALVEHASRNPLNVGPNKTVHEGYETSYRPLIVGGSADARIGKAKL
ncbi:hypothetical protein HDU85_002403 [Gaertneriomyces sp. JEL0708]|nr:hypothetical protein HDU85_002403 [Gaertneriomyces sp. JEL0708]